MSIDRWRYYRRAAMAAGVPELWADDAAQDIAIRVWRAGLDTVTVVRRAAIDVARRYGPRTRYGGAQNDAIPLDPSMPVYGTDIDLYVAVWDCRQALATLTERQRDGLRASIRGGTTNLQTSHAAIARRKLRALCA